MIPEIPRPVAVYLEAEEAKDVERFDDCFAADAIVHDEGHDHRGIPAIKAWKSEADAKYQTLVEPLGTTSEGPVTTIRARVSGTFPGSPIELRFMFTVKNDRIQELEIKP